MLTVASMNWTVLLCSGKLLGKHCGPPGGCSFTPQEGPSPLSEQAFYTDSDSTLMVDQLLADMSNSKVAQLDDFCHLMEAFHSVHGVGCVIVLHRVLKMAWKIPYILRIQ